MTQVGPSDATVRAFLRRVRRAVEAGDVVVTGYAAEVAFTDLGFDDTDITATLVDLSVADFERCEDSIRGPGGRTEVLWVFTPWTDDEIGPWVRLVERRAVVVVSFHPR